MIAIPLVLGTKVDSNSSDRSVGSVAERTAVCVYDDGLVVLEVDSLPLCRGLFVLDLAGQRV
jgi:hypothetical protein